MVGNVRWRSSLLSEGEYRSGGSSIMVFGGSQQLIRYCFSVSEAEVEVLLAVASIDSLADEINSSDSSLGFVGAIFSN